MADRQAPDQTEKTHDASNHDSLLIDRSPQSRCDLTPGEKREKHSRSQPVFPRVFSAPFGRPWRSSRFRIPFSVLSAPAAWKNPAQSISIKTYCRAPRTPASGTPATPQHSPAPLPDEARESPPTLPPPPQIPSSCAPSRARDTPPADRTRRRTHPAPATPDCTQSTARRTPHPPPHPQIEPVRQPPPPPPPQTVPKAQPGVPHSPAAIQNQPRAAEIRIAQQRHQRHVRFLLLEAVAVEHVILPHESQQRARIRLDRQTKLRLRVHYVPEARVGTAALGCPVERSSTAVHTTFSSASAIPMPPLTHRVATPRLGLRFSTSCSSVTVMRVPVHPMGCPIAIAPPFTLSRSRFKFNVRSKASTCAANASFNSISPNSCSLRLSFSSSFRSAGTGPIPIVRGSTPAEVTAAIRASGFRLFCFTKCSLATTTAAAPSVIPEEFPAVIVPGVSLDFENTGGSFPSFSKLASGNGCSSRANVVAPFFPSMVTGTISASKRPAAIAPLARGCDRS